MKSVFLSLLPDFLRTVLAAKGPLRRACRRAFDRRAVLKTFPERREKEDLETSGLSRPPVGRT